MRCMWLLTACMFLFSRCILLEGRAVPSWCTSLLVKSVSLMDPLCMLLSRAACVAVKGLL